jgi:hypothetical protein
MAQLMESFAPQVARYTRYTTLLMDRRFQLSFRRTQQVRGRFRRGRQRRPRTTSSRPRAAPTSTRRWMRPRGA